MNTALKYSMDEIVGLIVAKTGCKEKEVSPSADIVNDLGCVGDDFHELIEEYSDKFNVDLSSYLWYFHGNEEGAPGIGQMFFKAPNELVKRIPVTPQLLLDCANKGFWDVLYPEHKIPKRRYDLLINQMLVLIFIACLLYTIAKSY